VNLTIKLVVARLLIEALALVVAGLFVLAVSRLDPGKFDALTRRLGRMGRHRRLSVAAVGVAAFLVAMTISLFRPPVPSVHDEFSYLLAADTFASGRLTNPTHSMWQHFESFHIIHKPTYQSKYPPAQGLILALGQVLTGYPIAGVWLSSGLAAAALCWMLQGWVPPKWALLGGILVVFHVGIQLVWSQGFWGGNVAFVGGALLFGALPRLTRKPTVTVAVTMATGLIILANSRPFEGLVLSLPVAAVLMTWLLRKSRPPLGLAATRVAVPMVVVLSVGAAAMAHHNACVTGDPFKLPYQVWAENHSSDAQADEATSREEPAYCHPSTAAAHRANDARRRAFYTPPGWLRAMRHRILILWSFYFGGVILSAPIAFLPCILRRRLVPFVAGTLVLSFAASAAIVSFHPHYLAPVAPLGVLIVVLGLRHAHHWAGRKMGRNGVLITGLVAAYVVVFALLTSLHLTGPLPSFPTNRARIASQLEQTPGKHLVIVRYGKQHEYHHEWVYNSSDIDAAKIVWARDMGDGPNIRLIEHFRDRRPWLLSPDKQPGCLEPYQ
jgi:hypothetical protein